MGLAFVAVLGISALLSSSLAKSIVKPINELDFKKPESVAGYAEIEPLLRKISTQNKAFLISSHQIPSPR